MIKFKQKEYSLSGRTKSGLSGALKGVGAGIGLGGALGLLGGSGINGKQKLALSLASMILTVPFSAWAGYKAGVGIYDQKNQGHPLPSVPTPKKEEINKLADKLSKVFPELIGLQKIEEDKELKSLEPGWGDGDEYPVFSIYREGDELQENFIPILSYNYQQEEIGINSVREFWCTSDDPNKKINLKSYLLREYTRELKEYKDAKKKDSYGWDQEDYDEVISWIECVLKKVRQYL